MDIVTRLSRHPDVSEAFRQIAAAENSVKLVAGLIKNPDTGLSNEEEECCRGAVLTLSGAGVPEVDGEYTFVSFRKQAGCFRREGTWKDGELYTFSIYLCPVTSNQGGVGDDSQWFVTAAPRGSLFNSKEDIDLYYGRVNKDWLAIEGRILPPVLTALHEKGPNYTIVPAPRVHMRCVRPHSLELISNLQRDAGGVRGIDGRREPDSDSSGDDDDDAGSDTTNRA